MSHACSQAGKAWMRSMLHRLAGILTKPLRLMQVICKPDLVCTTAESKNSARSTDPIIELQASYYIVLAYLQLGQQILHMGVARYAV